MVNARGKVSVCLVTCMHAMTGILLILKREKRRGSEKEIS